MESKITREEQIKQAEIKYSNDTLLDGCDYIGQVAKQEAFIAGARWVDEHPKEGMVSLEKVYATLREMLYTGDVYDRPRLISACDTIEEFIEDFRKAMEE